jgi:hypothetical protein
MESGRESLRTKDIITGDGQMFKKKREGWVW